MGVCAIPKQHHQEGGHPFRAMSDDGDEAIDAQKAGPMDMIVTGAPDEFPAPWRAKPFADWQGRLLTRDECSKVVKILAACEDPSDLNLLVTYANSLHGLVDDRVRRVACTLPHAICRYSWRDHYPLIPSSLSQLY